jgi:hypothetical protein
MLIDKCSQCYEAATREGLNLIQLSCMSQKSLNDEKPFLKKKDIVLIYCRVQNSSDGQLKKAFVTHVLFNLLQSEIFSRKTFFIFSW